MFKLFSSSFKIYGRVQIYEKNKGGDQVTKKKEFGNFFKGIYEKTDKKHKSYSNKKNSCKTLVLLN